MSEQDDADANADIDADIDAGADEDVIEHVSRQFNFRGVPGLPALRGIIGTGIGIIGTGRRRIVVIAAACLLLVTAATLVTFRVTEGPRTALAGLITEVTTVPVGKSVPGLPGLGLSASSAASSAGAYSSTLLIVPDRLNAVSGPPLTGSGKPEVLYIATEYCPYCAIENWPLIVALSRFGQFTGLTTSRSPDFEQIPAIDSWTFYGSHYTSPYLSFVPVEQYSNVPVSTKANPDATESYRKLQQLTSAQQAIFAKYDAPGSTPFLDFGNRAVQIGSGPIPPQLMAGKSWPQLAAALRQPKTDLGAVLLNQADTLTAELCRLTGDRPASACPAFLRNVGVPS